MSPSAKPTPATSPFPSPAHPVPMDRSGGVFRCWTREMVRPMLGPGILPKRTVLDYLDIMIASRGQRLFGNKYSELIHVSHTVP